MNESVLYEIYIYHPQSLSAEYQYSAEPRHALRSYFNTASTDSHNDEDLML